MKLRYKQKLFLYFSVVFTLFSLGVLLVGQSREKTYRLENLEDKLEAYAEIVHASLGADQENSLANLDSLLSIFPDNIRLSVIDKQGVVLFDNKIEDLTELENHRERIEIIQAVENGRGRNIRTSASNQQPYLYFAKNYYDYFVRVALPYNAQTKSLLRSDHIFLSFILLFFSVSLVLLYALTNRFGKSINQLRDFALADDTNKFSRYSFPNDELGEIGAEIAENYKKLKDSEKRVILEREKLLQHVQTSKEGICFFTPTREVEFFNGLFIQYLNTLIEEPSSVVSSVFTDPIFTEVHQFLSTSTQAYFETQIHKQGKVFSIRVTVFEDKDFEIILNDITQQEKTRRLKQQMTSNIAHELRTPLTSIRGYLETALNLPLTEEKKKHFITQAHNLSLLLSETIQDMGLITSLEEAPQVFRLEEVAIQGLLEGLHSDLQDALEAKDIEMQWDIPEDLKVNGNANLLYSIFRNLADNAINYAGTSIKIQISMYHQDKDFYYFSFYDTGKGIQEEIHLNRLFERFYRINEGRTRETGGTGLGLSIVKNAILFHKGKITAKNRNEGGLEFLFQLRIA